MCVALLALWGCSSKQAQTKTPKPEEVRLALLGVTPLSLGASAQECQEAFPVPPDARKPASLDVEPGYDYAGWELTGQESFGVAFKKGAAVKIVHRLRLENMEETKISFDAYKKQFGDGARGGKGAVVEVVYKLGGARLTLVAKDEGGFVTFNETLEDLTTVKEDAKEKS